MAGLWEDIMDALNQSDAGLKILCAAKRRYKSPSQLLHRPDGRIHYRSIQ